MINLISKTPDKVIEQVGETFYHAHCGMFTTPFSGYDMNNYRTLWALDNGCYTRYEPNAIIRELKKWQHLTHDCIFAVVPDVVGNHLATLLMFREWLPVYKTLGYPVAFVLQNGATPCGVPYENVDALFIGGDDAFKYSSEVQAIVAEAHSRKLWIHAGRVGGLSRFKYMRDVLRVDSFDSSGFSIHPPKIKKWQPYIENVQNLLL